MSVYAQAVKMNPPKNKHEHVAGKSEAILVIFPNILELDVEMHEELGTCAVKNLHAKIPTGVDIVCFSFVWPISKTLAFLNTEVIKNNRHDALMTSHETELI